MRDPIVRHSEGELNKIMKNSSCIKGESTLTVPYTKNKQIEYPTTNACYIQLSLTP